MKNDTTTLKALLPPLAVYLGVAVYIALKAPLDVTTFLYSENGPYEVFSAALWLVLAAAVLFKSSLQLRLRFAASVGALLMCARELDLHKALFSMSFIKTNFYKSPDISLHDKLIGGLILLAALALLIYLSRCMLQFLRKTVGSETSASLLIYSIIIGVSSKVLDRFSSKVHEIFDVTVPADTKLIIVGVEESLEMLIPLLFILALLMYKRRIN